VQIFDFGYQTGGSAFLVMEFLEGKPLDQRLAKLRRFSVVRGAPAVPADHKLVGQEPRPPVAKRSNDDPGKIKTHTGALMGTPVYMSAYFTHRDHRNRGIVITETAAS